MKKLLKNIEILTSEFAYNHDCRRLDPDLTSVMEL